MQRASVLLILLALAACGGAAGWPLRSGESGWTGDHTFVLRDEPRPGDRFIRTARGAGDAQRFGLVSGRQRRLLEPTYVWLDASLSPSVVYAQEEPGDPIARFVIADDRGGPRVARVEPTEYRAVWALPWEEDGFPVLPRASLRPRPRFHLGERVAADGRPSVDLLDDSGRVVSTLPGRAYGIHFQGNAIVAQMTELGDDPARRQTGTWLGSVDGTFTGALLPPVHTFHTRTWGQAYADVPGQRYGKPAGLVVAFETGRTLASGRPLYWPLDDATGLPKVDPTGLVIGFEPIDVADMDRTDFWIAHALAADGPRLGILAPGDSLYTGPRWRRFEPHRAAPGSALARQVPIGGLLYVAEEEDRTWSCFVLARELGDGRTLGGGRIQLVPVEVVAPQPSKAALLAALNAYEGAVAAKEAAAAAADRAFFDEWAAGRLGIHVSHTHRAESIARRFGGPWAVRYARRVSDRTESGMRVYEADDRDLLQWALRQAEGRTDIGADDLAWVTARHTLLVNAARQRQLAEEEARRAWVADRNARHAADWRESQAVPAATGGGWTPPAYPSNDNYYQESQQRQAVTESLWRYTYGQQDWYLTR